MLAVDDGLLLGFDNGEWGGGLVWVSADGARHRNLSEDNVREIVRLPIGILVLTAVPMWDGGSLRFVDRSEGEWKAGMAARLGSSPRSVLPRSDGSAEIVTTRSLVRLRADRSIEVLHTFGTEQLMATSGALAPDGSVWIGLERFVLVLHREGTGFREEWRVPLAYEPHCEQQPWSRPELKRDLVPAP